jgi:hypothetical protein
MEEGDARQFGLGILCNLSTRSENREGLLSTGVLELLRRVLESLSVEEYDDFNKLTVARIVAHIVNRESAHVMARCELHPRARLASKGA